MLPCNNDTGVIERLAAGIPVIVIFHSSDHRSPRVGNGSARMGEDWVIDTSTGGISWPSKRLFMSATSRVTIVAFLKGVAVFEVMTLETDENASISR
jgi:hypothetical protein